MIYTDAQLNPRIREMIKEFENEVVEFKEAKLNYSFKDIGKYFSVVGKETEYVKNKGLANDVYKQLILNAIEKMDGCGVSQLKGILKGALPESLDQKQQTKKITNLLQAMKKDGLIFLEGKGHSAKWYLANRK